MAGNLDAKTVEAAKKRAATCRLSDGGGLLLEVHPTGARVWLCRVTVNGKRRDIELGGYPAVSLKAAREKAAEARKVALGGQDPMAVRQQHKRQQDTARQAKDAAETRTFRTLAFACIKAEAPGWRSNRTALLWESSLER